MLLAAALLYHERFWRLAVRQLLLTVGLVILLMGINHKSYLFVEQMLPFIRRMDAAGLSAMNDMRLNLSAPAVTALYLLTRGPIYDMYMLKLACMGAFLLMAVLAAHAADRRSWGLRGEALLLLCLILPQGFLTAGSAPQIDALSALLLVAALTLLDEKHPLAGHAALRRGVCAVRRGAVCPAAGRPAGQKERREGAACPRWRRSSRWQPALPRCFAGVPAGRAAGSLFTANFAVPEYAAGVPNLMSAFPRAAMEEMPEYALIRVFPEIDAVTNAPEVYTQAHLRC